MAFNFPQNPTLNQTYEYNGSVYKWNGSVWVLISGSSTLPLHSIVSISPPSRPISGLLWYNPSSSVLKVWVPTTSGGGSWQAINDNADCLYTPPVTVSVSPPSSPSVGDLWYSTGSSSLFLWVLSLGGGEWKDLSNPDDCPDTVPVSVSASPPVSPNVGDLWFDTINLTLFVRVSTPSGDEWQPATNPEDCTPEINFPRIIVSSGYPTNPIEGDLWFNPDTIGLSVWYEDIDGGQWVSLIREPGPPDLSDDDPQPLGAASPGISLLPSRSDHVHPMPSIDNLLGLNTTGKIDKSVIYYDAPNNEFKADSILTQYTLTDGGNF